MAIKTILVNNVKTPYEVYKAAPVTNALRQRKCIVCKRIINIGESYHPAMLLKISERHLQKICIPCKDLHKLEIV